MWGALVVVGEVFVEVIYLAVRGLYLRRGTKPRPTAPRPAIQPPNPAPAATAAAAICRAIGRHGPCTARATLGSTEG